MENINQEIQDFYLIMKCDFKNSFNNLNSYLFFNEILRNELTKMNLEILGILL